MMRIAVAAFLVAASSSTLAADPPASAAKPSITLATCEDVQGSAAQGGKMGGSLSPAGVLHNYWYEKYKKELVVSGAKVTLLEGPSHGKLVGPFHDVLGPAYGYEPNANYLGQDKVVFMVEVAAKRVKVATTLYVVSRVDGYSTPPCGYHIKRIGS